MTALAVMGFLLAGSCGRQEATGVAELAAALRQHGLAYDVSETAALGSIRAEGLRLTGPGLKLELYLIEDEDTMRQALAAAALAASAQRETGDASPVGAYARGHFFILVRCEPVEGQVLQALDRALGD